jgi:hypothetical protein
MVTAIEGYPFEALTERFSYRSAVNCNWKIFSDAFQEFYHAPILHAAQSVPAVAAAARQAGFEAPHYEIEGPHRMINGAGLSPWALPPESTKPMERLTRSGLFGAWDAPELPCPVPAGVNPASCEPWGLSSFQIWPNLVLLIWNLNWVHVYRYWPTGYHTMVYEAELMLVPARTARERLAHEMAAVTYKEYALQDSNTLEATQSMLESRVVEWFPLSDQEIACRHFHKTASDWVEAYQRERAGA